MGITATHVPGELHHAIFPIREAAVRINFFTLLVGGHGILQSLQERHQIVDSIQFRHGRVFVAYLQGGAFVVALQIKIIFTVFRFGLVQPEDADAMNIDPECIRDAITDRTRVIVPMHYAGVCCDMSAINAMFTVEDVEGQIRRTLVSGLSDAIAESKIPALDLAANYEELSQYALKSLAPKVESLGLSLTSFVIENISLPEEVEKSIDKRTSMGVVGDLNRYSQFQAAEAMREAANNPGGGMAGMGVGMGAGAAMGHMFAQSMNGATTVAPQTATVHCVACGKPIPVGSKFCPECGAPQSTAKKCKTCGAELKPDAKFCPECGQKVE